MKEVLDFLTELKVNNNREWFNANRDRYKRIRETADAFAVNFQMLVAKYDPEAAALSLPEISYRINRDTRFSPNKEPFKTHIGYFICPKYGKKSLVSGYYLHIEPGASMLCGGNYGLPGAVLKAIRRDIVDNIDEYREIVENPEFRNLFPTVGMDMLKTYPQGFDRNWEYIDYLRPRTFGVSKQLDDKFFSRENPLNMLEPYVAWIKRYNDFINFSIEETGILYHDSPRPRN